MYSVTVKKSAAKAIAKLPKEDTIMIVDVLQVAHRKDIYRKR